MGAEQSTPARAQEEERPAAAAPSALVIVGPSGVGKGTLINKLMESDPRFGFSCSHTTRPPREGEVVRSGARPRPLPGRSIVRTCGGSRWDAAGAAGTAPPPHAPRRRRGHLTRAPPASVPPQDGVHYHFTTHVAMEADIAAGKFLEHAHVHKNIYGTSVQAVQDVADSGRCCVLDIDVQGARQVRGACRCRWAGAV